MLVCAGVVAARAPEPVNIGAASTTSTTAGWTAEVKWGEAEMRRERLEDAQAAQARAERSRVEEAKREATETKRRARRAAATTKGGRSSGTRSAPSTDSMPSSDVWSALARCESGGDPSAHSSGGRYHGAFQFSLETWRGVGGSGDPHEHSFGTQLEMAQKLQARSGWGQWPRCARKLGLL